MKEGDYGISILAGWLALAVEAACLVCLHGQVGRYTPVRERRIQDLRSNFISR